MKKTKRKTKNYRIAIIASRFNDEIMDGLLENCVETLVERGIPKSRISVVRVPGAYELPFVANELARKKRGDAVIALGCVIKGETSHDVHIANWASIGLGEVALATRVPVLFGVLTPNNESQALQRSRKGPLNRGREVANAAVDLLDARRRGEF